MVSLGHDCFITDQRILIELLIRSYFDTRNKYFYLDSIGSIS